MPDVSSVSETQVPGYTGRQVSGTGNASLSIEDFYKLLAAQLKYQDADNPMDTSEMMAQMVQTQMISTINQMNQISIITYASSMIGKEVTVADIDPKTGMTTGETTGVVTGASIYGDTPMIFVDGKRYSVSQVLILGETGIKDPEDGSGEDDSDKVPGTGDADGTPGTDGADGSGGTPGTDGTDGTDGTPGTDGTDGAGGTPGTDGTDGTEGTPGTGGADGTEGTPETGGTDGAEGTPGTEGSDGKEPSA